MLATLSLVRREFGAYFLSPVAYVVLAVFLAVTGHLFYLTMTQLTAPGPQGIEFPMQLMLGDEKTWAFPAVSGWTPVFTLSPRKGKYNDIPSSTPFIGSPGPLARASALVNPR